MFDPEVPSSLSISDFILLPIYSSLIVFIFWQYRKNKNDPHYVFFIPGLVVKLLASVLFCIVYLYYYEEGGDTLYYFYSAKVVANLIFTNPYHFFKLIVTGDLTNETLSFFNSHTGWPYYSNDEFSFFLVRLISPLVYLSCGSYLICTLILAAFSYLGTWKLFCVIAQNYKPMTSFAAAAMLFIPTVIFWGSGILKDTIIIPSMSMCVCLVFVTLKKNKLEVTNSIAFIIFSYLTVSLKPYVYYSFLIAATLWIMAHYTNRIKIRVIRYVFIPLIFFSFGISGIVLLLAVGEDQGRFTLKNLEELSLIANADLKREVYQGSTFDIGTPDKSMLSKIVLAPKAISAAMFRPYLWEAKNIVMMCSAIENAALVLILFYALISLRNNPEVLTIPFFWFSFIFSLVFSFSIGISVSNFGTLVRLKSPMMPFFLLTLFFVIKEGANKRD